MSLLQNKLLGSTDLKVASICFGTSPLGNIPGLYGYNVTDDQAAATIEAVLDSEINFIDTSNGYGHDGVAERRIGRVLARRPLLKDVILATKVDPDPVTGDFSGKRVRKSVRESMERLGIDHIRLLHLHDPERIPFSDAMTSGGAVEALVDLREEGVVDYLGVAGGPVSVMQRYLDTDIFDVILTHNRFSLLDRSAESLFRGAHERGIGVLNAAPYGGGLLSKGPSQTSRYAYGEADSRVFDAAVAMSRLCGDFGVPLAAAALQFSLRSPFIDSTVVGVSAPERVAQLVNFARINIPTDLWEALEQLVPGSETWLDSDQASGDLAGQ